MRLRTHYLLLASSILVPAALFCGIALNVLLNAQHDAAIQRIEESARLNAMVIDADINRAQSVLQALASSSALAAADMQRFDAESRNVNAGPGAWIILYDSAGQQLINTRHPFGSTELSKRPDPDHVQRMLSSGHWNVSHMRWGRQLKNNFVMVEIPIRSATGRQYILAQAFSPEFFSHSYTSHAIPESWTISVIDGNGTIIAGRQGALEGAVRAAAPDVIGALQSAQSGVFKRVARDGTELYTAYTHSALSDWAIVIGVPVKEIDTAVWHGVGAIAIGLAIAMLAALTLTVFMGRKLVHFAAGAAQAARRLGRGAEVGTLPASGVDELDDLNAAILDASGRLRDEMHSRSEVERERNQLLVLEQDARARAERQNAAKDEFLAMLGHELRNPLSAVASAVHILDSEHALDAGPGARARTVLRRQTDHLRKLVDDLLEVNRALMGKLTLDKLPADLGDTVGRCVDTLQSSGRTGQFAFQLDIVPAIVDADSTRLVQIIDNILDNAVKYSPEGGRIEVTVRHADGFAELVVSDSGMGIPTELLPKVFTIFVQGKQSLQRVQGGLGIGLSLVRRLVEMHDGTVAIASAGLGQGTSVTVRLPLLADQAPPAPVTAATPGTAQRRVLLIEDNEDARDMMAMLLELLACEVLAASSGPQGIELAAAGRPEIAFIDIGLAGMDGYAVAKAMQADASTSHIVLIALTGYGSANDRQRAFAAGFSQHYTKPISIEQLQLALSSTALSAHN